MDFFYKINWHFFRVLAKIFFRLSTEGEENIPSSGPVILAANHCSYLDPPLITVGIKRQLTFLLKRELRAAPLLGWWLRRIGSIPVARGQGDMRSVMITLRTLREGKAILLFPEGTRSENGQMQPFETGAAWLAHKSQAPIVPVYISGTYEAYPRKAWFPRPKKIRTLIGQPLIPKGETRAKADSELIKEFTKEMERAVFHLKSVLDEKMTK